MKPFVSFGRETCGVLENALRREWLVTNGIGGYASGTVAGAATRRYHGLLVAAMRPPLDRTLLLAKLDEWAEINENVFPLACNEFKDGTIDPHGYHHIESFHLDGTLPVWRYALADCLLEKRVWMLHGHNTTYVTYRLVRGTQAVRLGIVALANHRDHHGNTQTPEWLPHLEICAEQQPDGLWHTTNNNLDMEVTMFEGAPSFFLSAFVETTSTEKTSLRWEMLDDVYKDFFWRAEHERGETDHEDMIALGRLYFDLQPGQTLCFVASTEFFDFPSPAEALAAEQARQAALIEQAHAMQTAPWIQQLVLATDQFMVAREDGRTVIAGYPWFTDWGRDTMIAIPGLALATGRVELARSLLRTFARYVSNGMLPNRFPDAGEALTDADYNTVDATLWFFEAVRATNDNALLRELFPLLEEIIAWHERGTRFGIRVDPADGLLAAGAAGVQLTWMDAKVENWVVTPREGKPVEINALWYHVLCVMADFAEQLGQSGHAYRERAERVRRSFARFWNAPRGYCFDVLDGPQGNDPALRPNQLFAVSLRHSPLTQEQQRQVVAVCGQQLLTSYGLRSLAATDPAYVGVYAGDRHTRDGAYHQGTTWAWLMGPFVRAHLRVHNDPQTARSFLEPFEQHLFDAGLGSISEIFDGNAPFTPRGCPWQAWSVAEILSIWAELAALDNRS